jgi:transcriptional regulator with GAF, ATPase, and Fis domain/tetratricopeptide (TPR) repeat protein
LREVGRGGAGLVFEAVGPSGTRVALKIAHPHHDEVLRREAELCARLMRRWGPVLHAFGYEEGRAYLALGFEEGEPLLAVVSAGRPVKGEELALVVGHAVASALAELHEADAVHGDVTPGNILVLGKRPKTNAASERAATLIDLSLSDTPAARRAGLTPRYADPASSSLVSPETDLFQLGLVLGELLFPAVRTSELPLQALEQAIATSPPTPLVRLVAAMASPLPGARPPAAHVASELAALLGLAESAAEAAASARSSIARHYLSCRRTQLFSAAHVKLDGPPLAWVRTARAALSCTDDPQAAELGPLGELDRGRWLTRVSGPAAASFALEELAEPVLAERMLHLAERLPTASFTHADFFGESRASSRAAPTGELSLLRALSGPQVSEAVLRAAEVRAADAPVPLLLSLGERLLATGQAARALLSLAARSEPEIMALAAEARRRTGDRDGACMLATRVLTHAKEGDEAFSRAHFVLARVSWELGRYEQALAHEPLLGPAEAAEIAALCHYAKGETDLGVRRVEKALSREGASARLFGLQGMLHHAEGDAERALLAFGRAVEVSIALGAISDEASYRTGEAAAALDLGDVGRGLSASTRAVLLCERGRERWLSGRAWLSRAGALVNAGATFEALVALAEAKLRADEVADVRCSLFADFIRLDLMPRSAERDELAAASLATARTLGAEDTLRALARTNLRGDLLAEAEALSTGASVTARLEYYRARAEQALESSASAREVIDGLLGLLGRHAPAQIRATAWECGQRLAARAGDREAAGRFEHLLFELCARIEATVPAAYRSRFASQSWVKERGEARGLTLPSGKLGELFSITRALSARDGLRELCEMTLDAMVLWSGVERGILLLPAPDGTLKVRSARNIAREDLRASETQRLSMSMAARAFEKMVTVVADDAWAQSGSVQGSVHALGLRSVLAVPLVAQGTCVGVVYLDDRQRKGAFGREELLWVELIGHLAAISIRDARVKASLRRMTRRAERAQGSLAVLLAEREKELLVVTERLAQAEGTRVPGMVGESMGMRNVLALIHRVGRSDVPVLVSGESGTGKELVARAIAESSTRKGRPFVGENCGSLPEPLLESTLFGHVKGAFTGAVASRVGLFDVANGGTLFLDEVGEMSPGMQVKLLRVLQDGEVRPVGGNHAHHVDVRIVCATHRDLPKMVEQGTFREDLFYRLNVVEVRVPPLRERREDIPLLVSHFMAKYAPGRKLDVTSAAVKKLAAFAWPGNVRQLENEIRRAVVLCDRQIDVDALSDEIARTKGKTGGTLRARIDDLETEALREALRVTQGNQTRAATLLGVSRFGLQKMKKRLGLP